MENNTDYILVDARGLPPPGPLELVLDAIDTLGSKQKVRLLIDREPFPLYDMLRENGFDYSSSTTEDYRYEVLIWHKT